MTDYFENCFLVWSWFQVYIPLFLSIGLLVEKEKFFHGFLGKNTVHEYTSHLTVSSLFLDTRRHFFGHKMKEINTFLQKVNLPDFLQRLPRSFKILSSCKATELGLWLLFYSLIVIKEFGVRTYYQLSY